MTARHQQRVGIEWALLLTERQAGLPSTEPTLPRLLASNGYRTGLVGKWHLGFRPEFGPNAHGFGEFFGLLSGNVDMYSRKYRSGDPDLRENERPIGQAGYLTELLTDRAVGFIERSAADPFFCTWRSTPSTGPSRRRAGPMTCARRRRGSTGHVPTTRACSRAWTAAWAASSRRSIRLQLAQDTLVIFTNDNGGERLSRKAPFFHHKGTLWEGGIRVPCLLRWPRRIAAGAVSSQAASTFDLTATILAATGTPPPRKRPPDGLDLLR